MAHVANVTVLASQIPSALTDLRVFINLGDMPSGFWDTVVSGGGDIRCYKSDGATQLARFVGRCDTTNNTGFIWVLYHGTFSNTVDTVIQIHVDGVSSEPARTATYGLNAVWNTTLASTGYIDVRDFQAGRQDDLTGVNGAFTPDANIFVGSSFIASYGGANQDASATLASNITADFTVQTYSSPDFYDGFNRRIFGVLNWSDDTKRAMLSCVTSGLNDYRFNTNDGSNRVIDSAGGGLTGTYQWITGVQAGTSTRNQVDGAGRLTVTSSAFNYGDAGMNRLYWHGRADSGGDNPAERFDGQTQRSRVFNGVLSEDHVLVEWRNMANRASFYTVTPVTAPAFNPAFARSNHLL